MNAGEKCYSSCSFPAVKQILDLLDLSTPIFAFIKAASEKRIDGAVEYSSFSMDKKIEELDKDLNEYKRVFESNGHIPFPFEEYRAAGLAQINKPSSSNGFIDYFAQRGKNLYALVSAIRRPIMAKLMGVTYEVWSFPLDNESSPVDYPLSCTIPQVRDSKAFRTQAAADLIKYGDSKKIGS